MQEIKEQATRVLQSIVEDPNIPRTTLGPWVEIKRLSEATLRWIVEPNPTATANTGPSNSNTGPSAGPSNPNTGPSTGPINPNTGPSTGPQFRTSWDPDTLAGKSTDWGLAWIEAETRWNGVSAGISTSAAPAATMLRFEAGMSLIHADLFGPSYRIDRNPTVRTLADYMLTRIWPEPRFVEKFLTDRIHNATGQGFPSPVSFADLSPIAKAFFIPDNLRSQQFDAAQKKNLRALYRRIMVVLHSDTVNGDTDTSNNLRDVIEVINKAVNESWSSVETLI